LQEKTISFSKYHPILQIISPFKIKINIYNAFFDLYTVQNKNIAQKTF